MERRAQDELGVSTVQLVALFHLAEHAGCRQKELADALGIQPAAVTGLVDRMAAAGLVQRRADADDARAQQLHATAAGKRIVVRARPAVRAMQRQLLAGFDDAELDVIVRFLTAAVTRELHATSDPSPPGTPP